MQEYIVMLRFGTGAMLLGHGVVADRWTARGLRKSALEANRTTDNDQGWRMRGMRLRFISI